MRATPKSAVLIERDGQWVVQHQNYTHLRDARRAAEYARDKGHKAEAVLYCDWPRQ